MWESGRGVAGAGSGGSLWHTGLSLWSLMLALGAQGQDQMTCGTSGWSWELEIGYQVAPAVTFLSWVLNEQRKMASVNDTTPCPYSLT